MGNSGSAPSPDPAIGQAALASAELGRDYLGWAEDQAKITNKWAADDRARYTSTFVPLENDYIANAQAGPDYGKVAGDVTRSEATVANRAALAAGQQERQLQAQGVMPGSGRSIDGTRKTALATELATAGAGNAQRVASRTQAEAKNDSEMANAINLGKGLAVNPATSMGLSNGSTASGFSGAMQGYGQQGNLLNTQYQQQMSSYQANQANQSSLFGGLGSLAGMAFSLSSKDAKENKRPVRGVLDVVKKMPVEKWKYKDGMADGGEHIGPYAEDFQRETGLGDGKRINIMDAVGVTMGAVKELSDKMDRVEKRLPTRSVRSTKKAMA
ncbi:hypothetical protein DL1_08450 [Thioclava dalianensis]|uniref:Peptidase S74 domain-containing protein n=1 Tax=Thioclava dalianensis TaxID=1185766 RepID=A0A074TAT1_9RHOB|nr:tail fiber domain-containing protein [Thioclava dalianensis]KEP68784.1 hypothetical protein DL1_08450 [Thioclava dalianensis]SFN50392.1 Chaperone of endosialidase [Thioclava dalianensis]